MVSLIRRHLISCFALSFITRAEIVHWRLEKRAMRSSLGVGLAILSSLLLLALVAELYYIFWWKKRCNSKLKLSSVLFCFKAPTPIPVNPMMPRSGAGAGAGGGDSESASVAVTVDKAPHHCHKGEAPAAPVPATTGEEELQMDAELMRLHSLAGPPRFLFTIKEETCEDLLLESDDGRSRSRSRGRLGDLLLHCTDSPFLTPLASPPLPLLQSKSKRLSLGVGVNFDSLKKVGFNPLFESMASPSPSLPLSLARSPLPKFKFLQEAEEKLQRKLSLLEASQATTK